MLSTVPKIFSRFSSPCLPNVPSVLHISISVASEKIKHSQTSCPLHSLRCWLGKDQQLALCSTWAYQQTKGRKQHKIKSFTHSTQLFGHFKSSTFLLLPLPYMLPLNAAGVDVAEEAYTEKNKAQGQVADFFDAALEDSYLSNDTLQNALNTLYSKEQSYFGKDQGHISLFRHCVRKLLCLTAPVFFARKSLWGSVANTCLQQSSSVSIIIQVQIQHSGRRHLDPDPQHTQNFLFFGPGLSFRPCCVHLEKQRKIQLLTQQQLCEKKCSGD